jgi:hypothetical protein
MGDGGEAAAGTAVVKPAMAWFTKRTRVGIAVFAWIAEP